MCHPHTVQGKCRWDDEKRLLKPLPVLSLGQIQDGKNGVGNSPVCLPPLPQSPEGHGELRHSKPDAPWTSGMGVTGELRASQAELLSQNLRSALSGTHSVSTAPRPSPPTQLPHLTAHAHWPQT